jgi:hypothetical protein
MSRERPNTAWITSTLKEYQVDGLSIRYNSSTHFAPERLNCGATFFDVDVNLCSLSLKTPYKCGWGVLCNEIVGVSYWNENSKRVLCVHINDNHVAYWSVSESDMVNFEIYRDENMLFKVESLVPSSKYGRKYEFDCAKDLWFQYPGKRLTFSRGTSDVQTLIFDPIPESAHDFARLCREIIFSHHSEYKLDHELNEFFSHASKTPSMHVTVDDVSLVTLDPARGFWIYNLPSASVEWFNALHHLAASNQEQSREYAIKITDHSVSILREILRTGRYLDGYAVKVSRVL